MGAWTIVRMAWLRNPQPSRLVLANLETYGNDPGPAHKAVAYQANPSKSENYNWAHDDFGFRVPARLVLHARNGNCPKKKARSNGRNRNLAPWGSFPGALSFSRSREYVVRGIEKPGVFGWVPS